jgi:hypothetical protein
VADWGPVIGGRGRQGEGEGSGGRAGWRGEAGGSVNGRKSTVAPFGVADKIAAPSPNLNFYRAACRPART